MSQSFPYYFACSCTDTSCFMKLGSNLGCTLLPRVSSMNNCSSFRTSMCNPNEMSVAFAIYEWRIHLPLYVPLECHPCVKFFILEFFVVSCILCYFTEATASFITKPEDRTFNFRKAWYPRNYRETIHPLPGIFFVQLSNLQQWTALTKSVQSCVLNSWVEKCKHGFKVDESFDFVVEWFQCRIL